MFATSITLVAIATLSAPVPLRREPAPSPYQTAVFAGGCFWGIEAVFSHLRGVHAATSGYATPTDSSAAAAGAPGKGFAEAVRVEYDPQEISYAQLLDVFFHVAHDPTQLDRQGPDEGTRYRSIVFVGDDAQRRAVVAYLDSLRANRAFAKPIVTEVDALRSFKTAEPEHKDYVRLHPNSEYVVLEDLPKLEHLRISFPALYRD